VRCPVNHHDESSARGNPAPASLFAENGPNSGSSYGLLRHPDAGLKGLLKPQSKRAVRWEGASAPNGRLRLGRGRASARLMCATRASDDVDRDKGGGDVRRRGGRSKPNREANAAGVASKPLSFSMERETRDEEETNSVEESL
jgi:hypothetical protein